MASDEYACKHECGDRVKNGRIRLSPKHVHEGGSGGEGRGGAERAAWHEGGLGRAGLGASGPRRKCASRGRVHALWHHARIVAFSSGSLQVGQCGGGQARVALLGLNWSQLPAWDVQVAVRFPYLRERFPYLRDSQYLLASPFPPHKAGQGPYSPKASPPSSPRHPSEGEDVWCAAAAALLGVAAWARVGQRSGVQ